PAGVQGPPKAQDSNDRGDDVPVGPRDVHVGGLGEGVAAHAHAAHVHVHVDAGGRLGRSYLAETGAASRALDRAAQLAGESRGVARVDTATQTRYSPLFSVLTKFGGVHQSAL